MCYYRKIIVFFCKLLILFLSLSANSDGQVINSGICNETNRFPITPYSSLIKITRQIPIDSILTTAYQQKFKTAGTKAVIFAGYDPYYYWFRFIIRNDEPLAKDLVILMAPMGMREGIFFQKVGNGAKMLARNGLIYPFERRPYQYSYFVYPFTINAKTTDTFYLSMDARHAYKSYGFALMRPTALRIFQNKVYFSFGLIVGLLSLFSLFNLYLYFSLKDTVHLWYSIYIALLIWIVLKNDQLDQEFLSSNPEFTFRLAPLMGIASVAIALLMHLIQQILTNIKPHSVLNKLSVIAKINVLVSGIAHFAAFYVKPDYHLEQAAFWWADKSTIACIVIIIIDCIYSIYKGLNSAIFILTAIIVFLVGAITRLLLVTNSSYLFPPSLFHLGMVLETLIISFGLIYRYRLDRKEKEEYRREKEELKNRFDKLLLQSKFEIQEQTLKNVSLEIHDNIGQILSLVKLNIVTIASDNQYSSATALRASADLLSKAISDLRDLSKSLNTEYIIELGLLKAIEYNLEQIKRLGNYETDLKITGTPYRIEAQKELIVFRMFQEILNNIIKHAHATIITVELNYLQNKFDLKVSDNGKGFDTSANSNKAGLGLRNIRSRAVLLEAICDIQSNQNGTSVCISMNV